MLEYFAVRLNRQ